MSAGVSGRKRNTGSPGEPPARGRKLGRSSERKQRQNENDAVRRLNREIHANFSAGDLFLGLDYGPKKYSELLRRAEARQEADRAAGRSRAYSKTISARRLTASWTISSAA